MVSATINGVQIHYEVSGEGPTLVFLHGLMGSIARSRLFGDDLDALAERMCRIDTGVLASNKRIVNTALEMMGARTVQRMAAEQEARLKGE